MILRPREAAHVFCEISRRRMPSPPAKVYRAGQGSGQRHHAKAGLLFPPGGHFRTVRPFRDYLISGHARIEGLDQKQSFELWLSSIIGGGLRQLASEIAMKQRRQQLAPREIAGRAEPCKNERSHRDHSAGHAGAFLDSIPELPLSRTAAARRASTSAAVGRSAPLRETVTAAAAMA
jgi:hypothetical protein